MKTSKFHQLSYAQAYETEIKKKIPGYDVMQSLLFEVILPFELQGEALGNVLMIAPTPKELAYILALEPTTITIVEPSQAMFSLVDAWLADHPTAVPISCYQQTFESFECSATFDMVICQLVVHFANDPVLFMERLDELLKVGGRLLFSHFSVENLAWWGAFATHHLAREREISLTVSGENPVMRRLSLAMSEQFFKSKNYQIVKIVGQIVNIQWLYVKK